MCGEILSKSVINPSESVRRDLDNSMLIPLHDFSLFFFCNVCHWWCIRESWDLCEYYKELDYIIVGEASIALLPGSVDEKPWNKALADPKVYDNVLDDLPKNLAAIFSPASDIRLRG
jgi:hypothetical protein